MNQRSDIDRVLQSWMADGPAVIPDRVVDVVAARIGVQRQRRAWPFQGRPFVTPLKLAAALAAAIVVAVVGYGLLPKGPSVGAPSSVPAPTSTPVATTAPLANGVLPAGRYRIRPFDDSSSLTVTADIPAGWTGYPEIPALSGPDVPAAEPVLIGWMVTDGLYSDPCQWDVDGTGLNQHAGDLVVGPSVDDLVAALRANTSYTSSAATPITVGGYQGQKLDLQLPGDEVIRACDAREGQSNGDYFVFPRGFYAQGPDNIWSLSIVDVAGTRLIVMISHNADDPEADVMAAEAIVGSMQFTP